MKAQIKGYDTTTQPFDERRFARSTFKAGGAVIKRFASILVLAVMTGTTGAQADMCDYSPSKLAGKMANTVGSSVVDAGRSIGNEVSETSYYSLIHAGSNLTMLGSSAAGSSATGAVGIVKGAVGALGTAGSVLLAPATIVVGAVTIIGVGAFEGTCYFKVDRITDPYEVRSVIEDVASRDEAITIVKTDKGDAMALEISGKTKTYLLRKLYIADGQLRHRDFGINTNLGPVLFSSDALPE